MPLATLDHIIVGAPELEVGVAWVESQLGVRPVAGGSHPAWGTRNALLSLGPRCYLEVLAPDPALDTPPEGCLFAVEHLAAPRMVGWALATDQLEECARVAAEHGVTMGAIHSGSRSRPDGPVLRWRQTDPRAVPVGGIDPFVIDWGETPHPGGSAPRAGVIERLELCHPDPGAVQGMLAEFGVMAETAKGDTASIRATLQTVSGAVELR